MELKYKKMKKGIIILIAILFVASVVGIYAGKNELWNVWFTVNEEEQVFQAITNETEWKVMNDGTDPHVGNVWTTSEYDSSFWNTAVGPFTQEIQDESQSATSFYLYEFDIENVENYNYMSGILQYSDAIIVYLNGEIIYTGNVPENGYYSNLDTGASNMIDEIIEEEIIITDLNAMVDGNNILAVEVHSSDEGSTNTYFNFEYLSIGELEYTEETPNTDGMILLKNGEDSVEVNWITEETGQYKIEYIEGTIEELEDLAFEANCKSVIMGNTLLLDGVTYENTGTIPMLKVETEYVYRVVEIGKTEGSSYYEFVTPSKQETEYLYVGIVNHSLLSEESNSASWISQVNAAVEIAETVDYLILGTSDILPDRSVSVEQLIENEMLFRTLIKFKEIPCLVSSFYQNEEGVEQIERSIEYSMNEIIISLDMSDTDYEGVKTYIEEAIDAYNRDWVIIYLNAAELSDGDSLDAEYLQMFEELDVDVVLVNGEVESSIELVEDTYYVYGGENVVKISISLEGLEIEQYDMDNGTLSNYISVESKL